MAFATHPRQPGAIAGINITPLVDVMLVLLVIFMIATPVLTQRIGIDLPGANPVPLPVNPPPPIELRIDAAGQVFWNGQATPTSALQAMLESELQRDSGNLPTLEIDASGDADYGAVARVLAAAENADWPRIGFVME